MRVTSISKAKAIGIFFVVFGHFVELTMYNINSDLLVLIRDFIYVFHMPLFIIISGFLSYSAVKRKDYNKVIIYFIYYLFMKIIFMLDAGITRGSFQFTIFSEATVPWYLLFLAMAMFLSIVIVSAVGVNTNFLIFLFVLGILSGFDYTLGDQFVLARLFNFYPFFYLGMYLKDKQYVFNDNSNKKALILSLTFIISTVLLAYFNRPYIMNFRTMISGKGNYSDLANFDFQSIIFSKILLYLIGIGLVLSIVTLMKHIKSNFLVKIGDNTLPVYFFHFLIVRKIVDYMGTSFSDKKAYLLVLYALLSVFIVVILSNQIFNVFRFVTGNQNKS